jgi:hypothetical protein
MASFAYDLFVFGFPLMFFAMAIYLIYKFNSEESDTDVNLYRK